jgi:hypothetical protein
MYSGRLMTSILVQTSAHYNLLPVRAAAMFRLEFGIPGTRATGNTAAGGRYTRTGARTPSPPPAGAAPFRSPTHRMDAP